MLNTVKHWDPEGLLLQNAASLLILLCTSFRPGPNIGAAIQQLLINTVATLYVFWASSGEFIGTIAKQML
jgi:hypothetical protein